MFVGRRHGDRVGAMVLLDSPYDLTVPEIAQWEDESGALPMPALTPGDRVSYAALNAYRQRVDGFRYPEEELRQWRPPNPDGTPGRGRQQGRMDMAEVWDSLDAMGRINFRDVTPPTLAIYALQEGPVERFFPWIAEVDSAGQAAVRAFHAKWTPGGRDEVRRRQAERARALPRGEVVTVVGGKHYVFLCDTEETVRLIDAFLGRH